MQFNFFSFKNKTLHFVIHRAMCGEPGSMRRATGVRPGTIYQVTVAVWYGCAVYMPTAGQADPRICEYLIGQLFIEIGSTKRDVILQQMKTDLEFAQQWVPDIVNKGEVSKGA